MKMNEIKEMPVAELQDKNRQLRRELFDLNIEKGNNPREFEKSHRIRQVRRDIARVETALTDKNKQTAAAG